MDLKQFGKLVRNARLQRGKTNLMEFAQEIGYSKPHLNQIENATAKPSMQLVQKLIESLGLNPSVAYNLAGYQTPNLFANKGVDKQNEIIILPIIMQELVGENFDEGNIKSMAVSIVKMPKEYLYEILPKGWEEHKLFVLKICESSMENTIGINDTVICDENAEIKSGDIAVFKYNHKLIVRRYIKEDGIIILKADNPKTDVIVSNNVKPIARVMVGYRMY